jgi:hypothetical protein
MGERLSRTVQLVREIAAISINIIDTGKVSKGMTITVRTGKGLKDVVVGEVVEQHYLQGEITLEVDGERQTHSSRNINFLH